VSNIILTLTKLDVSNSKKIEEYTTKIKALIEINKTIAISAYQQTNFHQLMQLIKPYLTNKNSDLIDLDDNDKFIISEIIREQVIFNTKQELPYATAVVVEKVDYDKIKTLTTINALIYVEKDSQKPIIIGKGGQMIKKIGTIARNELSKIYDGKINLQLLVKVQND
jgi:GTP-binding protein Era